jgi:type II secretory pathway pseudopilin PulG
MEMIALVLFGILTVAVIQQQRSAMQRLIRARQESTRASEQQRR